MKAQCLDCGHGPWELQKDDPADYQSGGPRCADPECRSRNVEILDGEETADGEADDDGLPYVAAFALIEEEGATPLDLVRHSDLDLVPDEARELVEEYNDLDGDFYLMEGDEIEERAQQAYAEGRERGRQEGEKRARQQTRRKVEAAREEAYNRGFADAFQQSQFLTEMEGFQTEMGQLRR